MSRQSTEDIIKDVQEAARGITEKHTREYFLKCGAERRFPDEMWMDMGAAGLLGLGVPEEAGGSGLGVTGAAALVETMTGAGLPPFLFLITAFARNAIVKHGTKEQIERFVKPTILGTEKMAFAITEPNAGTNSVAIESFAQATDDGYILNGQKVYITGAAESKNIMIVCRTQKLKDVPKPMMGVTLMVVDRDSPGVECKRLKTQVAPTESQYEVFLENVKVTKDRVVGEPGKGFIYMFDCLNPERVLTSALGTGTADMALRKAVEYVKVRSPFGVPIGSYQAVQHMLSRAKTNLEAARLMMYEGARMVDEGGPPVKTGGICSMAKLLTSESAFECVDVATQVHGGYGLDEEYDITTLYPLARTLRIAPVNNESVLCFVGESVLGLPKSY